MTLSELCIRRPVMTTLITATIIAFGVFGFRLLPVSALPKVDFPTIAVTATLPGASADTMAASVAGVIERQLSTIAGISSMTSNSWQGTSVITIQFDLNRNIDAAALDVQTALTIAQRRLPIEMRIPPSFRKVNPADFPVLFIVLGSPTLPLSTVNEYADITIGQALSQLPGVAQVSVYGAQKFAIRVQADPEAAAARGQAVNVLSIFSEDEIGSIPRVFRRLGAPEAAKPANRILLPTLDDKGARQQLLDLPEDERKEVLESHCIDDAAWQALVANNAEGFVKARTAHLLKLERDFMQQHDIRLPERDIEEAPIDTGS